MMKTPTGFQIGKSLIWVIITDMSTERDKGINLTCGLLSSFDSWPIKLRRLDWLIKIHSWAQNEEEIIEIIPNYETEKLYKIDKKTHRKSSKKCQKNHFVNRIFLTKIMFIGRRKNFTQLVSEWSLLGQKFPVRPPVPTASIGQDKYISSIFILWKVVKRSF